MHKSWVMRHYIGVYICIYFQLRIVHPIKKPLIKSSWYGYQKNGPKLHDVNVYDL